jgi:hypothetical protein
LINFHPIGCSDSVADTFMKLRQVHFTTLIIAQGGFLNWEDLCGPG